jgi:ABC-type transport system involved in multi-copper enzyme maturation permease subunit
LMVPSTRFQIVLQTAVYPWLAAMRVAILLLPFYILCVALEKVNWSELFFLYLFYAGIAVSFPVLRKPGLGDTAPSLPSAQPGLNTQTTQANVALGSPEAQNLRSAQQSGSGNGGMSMMAFMMPMCICMFAFAAGRGPAGMYTQLSRYFPDNIIQIMPASLISWPLIIARMMAAPLQWFSFHLWPIVFIVPLTILQRYISAIRTAEFLQVGNYRDLAGLSTYVMRRKLEIWYRASVGLAFAGYLWKWLILDATLAPILGRNGNLAVQAQAALLYIVLCISGYALLSRITEAASWQRLNRAPKTRLAIRKTATVRTLVYVVTPLISNLGFYLVCCVLALTNPFPPAVAAVAGKMLVLIAAACAIGIGSDAMLGGWSAMPKLLWCIAAVSGFNAYGLVIFKWLGMLSPLLGFAYISSATQSSLSNFYAHTSWWQFASMQMGVGLLMTAVGFVRLKSIAASAKLAESQDLPELDPTVFGAEVFRDEAAISAEGAAKTESPLALAIIRLAQRSGDNAVAIKELRTRLRGRLTGKLVKASVITLAIGTVAMFQFPEFPDTLGDAIANGLYGNISQPAFKILADINACFYIVLGFLCLLGGFMATRLFSVEKEKSTLGFILLTPMTIGAIVRGKFTGYLISASMAALLLMTWTLGISFAIVPAAGPRALLMWAAVCGASMLLLCTITALSLCAGAVMSRFTTNNNFWRVGFAVGIQVLLQSSRFIIRPIYKFLVDAGITAEDCMKFALSGAAAGLLISYLLTVWAIGRYRKGDLKFAESRKEN